MHVAARELCELPPPRPPRCCASRGLRCCSSSAAPTHRRYPITWLREICVFPDTTIRRSGEILRPIERDHRQLHLVDVENMRYSLRADAAPLAGTVRAECRQDPRRNGARKVPAPSGSTSTAGSRTSRMAPARRLVYQVLLSHGFDNSVPLTRHHHYAAIEATSPALDAGIGLCQCPPALRGAGRRSARTSRHPDRRPRPWTLAGARSAALQGARSPRRDSDSGILYGRMVGLAGPRPGDPRACSTLTCAPGSNCRPSWLADAIAEHLPTSPMYGPASGRSCRASQSYEATAETHYEVGNDFYRMLLGKHMIYSCTCLGRRDDAGPVERNAKLEMSCRKARARGRASAC